MYYLTVYTAIENVLIILMPTLSSALSSTVDTPPPQAPFHFHDTSL